MSQANLNRTRHADAPGAGEGRIDPRGRAAPSPAQKTHGEGAFLGRQAYRLGLARDALVRELAGREGGGTRGVSAEHEAGPAAPGLRPPTIAEELEAMLARKLRRRLLRVVRALEKISEGTYGLCDVTGEPIPRTRLEQVPEELETFEGRRFLRPTAAKASGRR